LNLPATKSPAFPWYDSPWLKAYTRARHLIQHVCPGRLAEFENAFTCLRTRPDFRVQHFPKLFGDEVMARIKQTILGVHRTQLEMHETRSFGRFVVHDHPYFTELQHSTVDIVSEAVGEPVESCYNFLSLYTKQGVCPVHLDSPQAKWTLDFCIDQSEPWPIHFSQVVSWPENFQYDGEDWQDIIKNSPQLRFSAYSLEPGQAVVFSGSSQWHYRDPIPATPGREQFCRLLFFHFVPKGMNHYINPKSWAKFFDIPELGEFTGSNKAVDHAV
jgi:hypothetical protein